MVLCGRQHLELHGDLDRHICIKSLRRYHFGIYRAHGLHFIPGTWFTLLGHTRILAQRKPEFRQLSRAQQYAFDLETDEDRPGKRLFDDVRVRGDGR